MLAALSKLSISLNTLVEKALSLFLTCKLICEFPYKFLGASHKQAEMSLHSICLVVDGPLCRSLIMSLIHGELIYFGFDFITTRLI